MQNQLRHLIQARRASLLRDAPRHLPLRVEIWALATVMAVGVYFRFSSISANSLWVDEGFIYAAAQMPVHKMWTVPFDVHPPLYAALVKPIIEIWRDEAAVRLAAAVFSCLAMAPFYLLARRLIGNAGALAGLAVFACSYTNLVYANSGRNYATLLFFCLLAFAALYRVALIWGGEARFDKRKLIFWAIVYVLSSILALYTHVIAVFYILFANIVFLARRFSYGRVDFLTFALKLTVLNLPVLLAWTPWLSVLLSTAGGFSWLEQPDLPGAVKTLLIVVLPNKTGIIGVSVFVLLLIIGAVAAPVHRKGFSSVVGFHLVVFPVAVWVFGVVFKPIYMERVILPATIGGALLIGAAIAYLKPPRLALAAGVSAVLVSLWSAVAYQTRDPADPYLAAYPVQDWRSAVASEPDIDQAALILCSSFSHPTLSFYARNSDIYVPLETGDLLAVTDERWLNVFGDAISHWRDNHLEALVGEAAKDGVSPISWTDLAARYDSIIAFGAPIYCDASFFPETTRSLEERGFTANGIRTFAGVEVQDFPRAPSE